MTAVAYAYDRLGAVRSLIAKDERHLAARAAEDMADWLAWLRIQRHTPATLDIYARPIIRLLRMFPDRRYTEFTDAECAHVLTTYPEKSWRTMSHGLRSFFKWGVDTDRIDKSPMEKLGRPMQENHRPLIEVFDQTEIDLLEALPDPDGPLMMLMFETGLRQGELRALQGRHVQFPSAQIVVQRGKGGKPRRVPMSLRLMAALVDTFQLNGIDDDSFLWPMKDKTPPHPVIRTRQISHASFHAWWNTQIRAAGVDYRKPHTTRHTFATKLARAGVPIEQVAELLGHASYNTTKIYYHLTVDDLRSAVEALTR